DRSPAPPRTACQIGSTEKPSPLPARRRACGTAPVIWTAGISRENASKPSANERHRMFLLKNKEMLITAFFILVFSSTSLSYWLLDYSWLEQQRITQLLLVSVASAALFLGYLRHPGIFA